MSTLSNDIWCKYAEGIQNWAGKNGEPDPNAVYYIASAINMGPAAGSFVPEAHMNRALSRICDALISSASPVYNPGAAGSYFDNVARYIAAVKLDKSLEQGLEQQLKAATEAADAAGKEYSNQRNIATAGWADDQFSGRDAGVDLQTWATSNAAFMFAAQQARDARTQLVTQLNSQIFGPGAAKLTNQQSMLMQADNRLVPVTGLNMKVSGNQITPKDYRKYYQALIDGTVDSLPPMSEGPVSYMPEYSIDSNYRVAIDEWARVPLDAEDEFHWNFKSEQTKDTSWTKLGHEEGVGGFQIGWIRISGGASNDWKDSEVTNETGSFEIQLSAQRASLFNITPGAWNVKNFRHTYPNTIGSVDVARDAVLPTQLLCASRVKLRVKFSGNIEKAFDKAVKDVKGGSGALSILGFSIGATGSRTEEENSHESDLVKRDGWYDIKPTLVAGGCSMLAVIGSKFAP